MFALNLDKETNRVLSACIVNKHTPKDLPRVDNLPEGDITDYLFVEGEFVYEPIEKENE